MPCIMSSHNIPTPTLTALEVLTSRKPASSVRRARASTIGEVDRSSSSSSPPRVAQKSSVQSLRQIHMRSIPRTSLYAFSSRFPSDERDDGETDEESAFGNRRGSPAREGSPSKIIYAAVIPPKAGIPPTDPLPPTPDSLSPTSEAASPTSDSCEDGHFFRLNRQRQPLHRLRRVQAKITPLDLNSSRRTSFGLPTPEPSPVGASPFTSFFNNMTPSTIPDDYYSDEDDQTLVDVGTPRPDSPALSDFRGSPMIGSEADAEEDHESELLMQDGVHVTSHFMDVMGGSGAEDHDTDNSTLSPTPIPDDVSLYSRNSFLPPAEAPLETPASTSTQYFTPAEEPCAESFPFDADETLVHADESDNNSSDTETPAPPSPTHTLRSSRGKSISPPRIRFPSPPAPAQPPRLAIIPPTPLPAPNPLERPELPTRESKLHAHWMPYKQRIKRNPSHSHFFPYDDYEFAESCVGKHRWGRRWKVEFVGVGGMVARLKDRRKGRRRSWRKSAEVGVAF